MTAKGDDWKGDGKDITLRDVIVHMQSMEERLSSRIDGNTFGIEKNTLAIQQLDQRLTTRIDSLEVSITALGEDFTATMEDTFKIRKHVGMATVDNE